MLVILWHVSVPIIFFVLKGCRESQKLKNTELENEIGAKCYFEVVDAVSEF